MSFYRNSMWSFINIIGVQLLAMLTNIILARLMFPEIFGVLGMAMVFMGLMMVFQEAGISSYLIYKEKISNEIISTTFWMNVLISLVIAAITYGVSDNIGGFYDSEEVVTVVKYISFGLILGSAGITSRAILMKRKNFRSLATIDISAEVVSTILAIIFALKGFFILSITTRMLIRPLIQSILLLWFVRPNISSFIKMDAIYEIVPYSSKFLSSQIFIYMNNNIDYLMIGKLLGSKNLGLYTLAYQWSVLARFYISGAINKVFFPEVASKNEDLPIVKKIYIKLVRKLAFYTFPICIGLLVITPEFIEFIYGQKWMDSVTILQLLLIVGMITSIGTLGGSIFNGLGRPEIEMRFNLLSVLFLAVFIYFGSKFGLVGIGIGILIRTLIFEFAKQIFVNKLINLQSKEFFVSVLGPTLSSLCLYISVYFIKDFFLNVPLFLNIVFQILVGVISYAVASFYFSKEEFDNLYSKFRIIVSKI